VDRGHLLLDFVLEVVGSYLGHVQGALTVLVDDGSAGFIIIDQLEGDELVAVLGCDMESSVLVHDSLLVHVLAFTKQYSDLVEISLFAGFPDVCEGLLSRLVFGHVEGQFVLGGAHLGELIGVSFPLQESLDNLSVAVVCCIVESSPLPLISSVDVGTSLK